MIWVTFALNFWVPFNLVWVYLKKRHASRPKFWERIYRTIFVIFITVISIAFPNVTDLMGLVRSNPDNVDKLHSIIYIIICIVMPLLLVIIINPPIIWLVYPAYHSVVQISIVVRMYLATAPLLLHSVDIHLK